MNGETRNCNSLTHDFVFVCLRGALLLFCEPFQPRLIRANLCVEYVNSLPLVITDDVLLHEHSRYGVDHLTFRVDKKLSVCPP